MHIASCVSASLSNILRENCFKSKHSFRNVATRGKCPCCCGGVTNLKILPVNMKEKMSSNMCTICFVKVNFPARDFAVNFIDINHSLAGTESLNVLERK